MLDYLSIVVDMGTYEDAGKKIGKLVDEKNLKYGASFDKTGELLKIYCPDGIRPDQYDAALFFARMSDKMFRVFTDKDAFSESPYWDMTGYCLLAAVNDDHKKERKNDRQTTLDMWDDDFEPDVFTETDRKDSERAEIIRWIQSSSKDRLYT